MNEHETYVSLEVAKLLEKAGFDWKCRKCYNKGVLFDIKPDEIRAQCPKHSSYDVLAPTLEVAQRWLREVRREYVGVHPIVNRWFYSIHKPNFGHYYRDKQFVTYEEAQEAGLKKCLTLILEEK